MARFDIYSQSGGDYLLDCQADVLHTLNTRLIVPLLSPEAGPLPIARLNPTFRVGNEEVIMYTQFAASVPTRELGIPVGSLIDEDRTIMNALDMLLTGC